MRHQYVSASLVIQSIALIAALLEATPFRIADVAGFAIFFQMGMTIGYLTMIVLNPFQLSPWLAGTLTLASIFLYTVWVTAMLQNYLPGVIQNYPFALLLELLGLASLPILLVWSAQQRCQHWRGQATAAEECLSYRSLRQHFLFNTLNTTAYLIRIQPELAETNLIKLAQLYRTLLLQPPMVTLQEELTMTKDYLSLEQARLGNRLRVEWKLPQSLPASVYVPALILQPLVENAVYHGIESLAGSGLITIIVTAENDYLCIAVSNPCADNGNRSTSGNRIAQRLIRRRLSRIYGADCHLQMHRTCNHYSVNIKISYRRDYHEYINN